MISILICERGIRGLAQGKMRERVRKYDSECVVCSVYMQIENRCWIWTFDNIEC